MAVSQNVRYGEFGPYYNPSAILDMFKPGRILVNNVNPLSGPDGTGEDKDYYINSVTGDLFENTNGQWNVIYNFDTGGGGTGITNIENIGEGIGIFKDILGSTAHLKTLVSTGNQINITPDIPIVDSITLSMSDAYKPVTLSKLGNFPLEAGLGSGTLNPNGLLGSPDYNRGSLFVQVGTVDKVYVCNDPASKVWVDITGGGDAGVTSIQNTRTFGGQIWRDTVGGVASLKVIRGGSSIEVENFGTDFIDMKVPDTYKPLTLSNVDNVKIGYGEPAQPLGTDDVTKGYVKGSLYTEIEPAGANKLWICQSPTPAGSALWAEYAGSGSSVKQSALYYNVPPVTVNFANTNFNNLPIIAASTDFAGGATWSSVATLGTILFRRGPTTAAGKRYLVNVKLIIEDSAGATSNLHLYTFRMVQNPSGTTVTGSAGQIALNASSAANRGGTCTMPFIITSTTAATDEWYLQIKGSIAGAGGPPPSVSLNEATLTFTEI